MRKWRVNSVLYFCTALLVLGAGPSRADTAAGLMDFRQGRFAEAFQEWQSAAAADDARGSLYLGVLFDAGLGVPRDPGRALEWYRRAADQGSAAGAFNVGVMYDAGLSVGHDASAAVVWYARAASQGFGRAEYNLAMLYEAGLGVTADRQRAIALYRRAADHGISAAQGHLATLGVRAPMRRQASATDPAMQDFQQAQQLLLSRGVAEVAQAVDLFRRAAEQNNAVAEYDLAYCYDRGLGLPVDGPRAREWYRRAALHAANPALRAMALAGANSATDSRTTGSNSDPAALP